MRIFRSLAIVAAAMCLSPTIAPTIAHAQDDSNSATLTPHVLAPNLVVISGAGGNSTLLWGPDGSLVVDGKMRDAAPSLQAAIAATGAPPARILLNTHWHGDHSGGNAAFARAGAIVMAHENIRTRLEAAMADAENHLSAADLPTLIWQAGVNLTLNGQHIRVIHIPRAHTDGDSIVYFAEANVIAMGDNYLRAIALPFTDMESGGNALGMLDAANAALALANPQTRFVPGHGLVASHAEMLRHRDQLAAVIDAVRTARAEGKTLAQILTLNLDRLYPINQSFLTGEEFVTSIYDSLNQQAAQSN